MIPAASYNTVKNQSKQSDADIMVHYAFVKRIAKTLSNILPSCVDTEDLVQIGLIKLLEIYDQFDATREISFEGFACVRIKGEMIDYIRQLMPISKEKVAIVKKAQKFIENSRYENGHKPRDTDIAMSLNISLAKYHSILYEYESTFKTEIDKQEISDPNILSPEHYINENETKTLLIDGIQQLAEKEQTILSLYYYENLTQSEVAQVMGLTESRVCQLLNKIKG